MSRPDAPTWPAGQPSCPRPFRGVHMSRTDHPGQPAVRLMRCADTTLDSGPTGTACQTLLSLTVANLQDETAGVGPWRGGPGLTYSHQSQLHIEIDSDA